MKMHKAGMHQISFLFIVLFFSESNNSERENKYSTYLHFIMKIKMGNYNKHSTVASFCKPVKTCSKKSILWASHPLSEIKKPPSLGASIIVQYIIPLR